jgi:predicted transcriptional regulator
MRPNEIRAALALREKKQVKIAEALNVSETAVTRVIDRKSTSKRIRAKIAEFVGESLETVFPEAA